MSEKTNYLFLIGAPKCGTSSLARMLGTHPDVVVAASKEPAFFTDFSERSWSGPGTERFTNSTIGDRDIYEGQFSEQPSALWRLDASTDYLSCPFSAERISQFRNDPEVGEVRIAAILRDPVARAISEYQHTVRDGFETRSLRHAIENENERLESGMHPLFGHVYRGRYASQIERYRKLFDDILILDYHSMRDGMRVVSELTGWLGIGHVEAQTMASANKSHVYRSSLLHRTIENRAVKGVARTIVPKGFRDNVRQTINRINQTSYSPSAVELQMLRDALREEIDACVADPKIPTDNWTLALDS